MDSNMLIERMNDVSLLANDTKTEWDAIISKYPYFSTAQLLHYGNAFFHQSGKPQFTALHKHDPIEFVRFIHQIKNTNIITEELAKPIEVFDQEKVDDIIEKSKALEVEESIHEPETIKHSIEVKETTTEEEKIKAYDKLIETAKEIPDIQQQDNHMYIDIIEKIRVQQEPEEFGKPEDILEMISELPNNAPYDIITIVEETATINQIENSNLLSNSQEVAEVNISANLPSSTSIEEDSIEEEDDEDKSLMVMMSFTDWLKHFKQKTEHEKSEAKDRKALKTAWQKEKLAEAADEEIDEIPEPIFKQAMESISTESNLISESLAEILAQQGKTDKAIAMYKKLSLRNPEKSTYFASLITNLNLNND